MGDKVRAVLQEHHLHHKQAKLLPQNIRLAVPMLLQVLLAEHARMKEVRERREAEKKEREEKRMAELRCVGHAALGKGASILSSKGPASSSPRGLTWWHLRFWPVVHRDGHKAIPAYCFAKPVTIPVLLKLSQASHHQAFQFYGESHKRIVHTSP